MFQRLQNANIKLNPSICKSAHTQVHNLGNILSKQGIQPDSAKITAVKEYPVSKTAKDLRSFLGLGGYYRKSIQGYAKISSPLCQLSSKDVPFKWTDACQVAFGKLKMALTTAPFLVIPDFNSHFQLHTDASDTAVRTDSSQRRDGQEVVVAYAGRQLNAAERNYMVSEKECLALVYAVKHSQRYLYGAKFLAFSDHKALSWLFSLKDTTGD